MLQRELAGGKEVVEEAAEHEESGSTCAAGDAAKSKAARRESAAQQQQVCPGRAGRGRGSRSERELEEERRGGERALDLRHPRRAAPRAPPASSHPTCTAPAAAHRPASTLAADTAEPALVTRPDLARPATTRPGSTNGTARRALHSQVRTSAPLFVHERLSPSGQRCGASSLESCGSAPTEPHAACPSARSAEMARRASLGRKALAAGERRQAHGAVVLAAPHSPSNLAQPRTAPS